MNWNPNDYAKNSSAQLEWARELISRLAFNGAETVLDVGCGDGKITAEFARVLPRGFVLGIDSSPEFVAYASQHYPRSVFAPLHFQQMDARALDIDRQFDLVFSNATLHWVDDHRAFLRGASRHLRPGGRLILSCGGAGNAAAVIAALEHLISSPVWRRYFREFEFPYHFHSPDDYAPWLAEAGFNVVRSDLVEKDMVHANPTGLAGWIRTTWMPYTQRLPHQRKRLRFRHETSDDPAWATWRPDFSKYDVVLSAYNNPGGKARWPVEVRQAFEKFGQGRSHHPA